MTVHCSLKCALNADTPECVLLLLKGSMEQEIMEQVMPEYIQKLKEE